MEHELAAEFQKDVRSPNKICKSKVFPDSKLACKLPTMYGKMDSVNGISTPTVKCMPDVQEVKIPRYQKTKERNGVYESKTLAGSYPYKLLIRPNGLKFTKGYGKCIGIWLKPEPCKLEKPVKVYLSIVVKTQDSSWDCGCPHHLI